MSVSVFEFVFEGGSRLAVFRLAWVESVGITALSQISVRVSRPLNTLTLTSLEHELEHAHAHAHASPLARDRSPTGYLNPAHFAGGTVGLPFLRHSATARSAIARRSRPISR